MPLCNFVEVILFLSIALFLFRNQALNEQVFYAFTRHERSLYHSQSLLTTGAVVLMRYLYTVSRSFLGCLSTVIDHAVPLKFEDLAEGTRKILREDAQPQYEDSLELETFFYAGDLHDFEALLDAPYEYEYFVTRNQVAALEAHLIDDFSECLTAKDVIELPEDARDEYVLYHWDYPTNSRQIVQQLVDKLHEQLDFFNDSIPYQPGASSTDQRAASVRVVYRLS